MSVIARDRRVIDELRWLRARNDSGDEIPAFSPVRITGTVTVGPFVYYKIDQADKDCVLMDYKLGMAFSGPRPIPAASGATKGYGRITRDFPLYAAYTGTAPTAGGFLGIANGTWTLTVANYGFICVGDIDTDAKACQIIPAPPLIKGKPGSTISKGTTPGNLTLYDATGAAISPTCTVPVISPRGDLTSGKWAGAAWTHDCWDGWSEEC